jgi:hypothetical protein
MTRDEFIAWCNRRCKLLSGEYNLYLEDGVRHKVLQESEPTRCLIAILDDCFYCQAKGYEARKVMWHEIKYSWKRDLWTVVGGGGAYVDGTTLSDLILDGTIKPQPVVVAKPPVDGGYWK